MTGIRIGNINYLSITEALRAAKANDTIQLDPGVFAAPSLLSQAPNVTLKGSGTGSTFLVNTPILGHSGQGKNANSFSIQDLTFDYSGLSGYIFSPSIGSIPYNPANPVITSFSLRNTAFKGVHLGNPGVSGTYMDISGAKNTIFDGISVSLSGQSGYNQYMKVGGGFFIFNESGSDVQILNSEFNESGYSTSIIILFTPNARIVGNRFSGAGLIKEGDINSLTDNPRGERFYNAGGIFANNRLSNGAFFDYFINFTSDNGAIWRDYKVKYATPDNTFGLRTNVTGNTFDAIPGGHGILIRADVAPEVIEQMLIISGNTFNNGLPIRNDISMPYDFVFGQNLVNGILFDHLRPGGKSNDQLNTTRPNGLRNWISGGPGNDKLYSSANGFDAFVFYSPLNPIANLDRIYGFETGTIEPDEIWLDKTIFSGLTAVGDRLEGSSFTSSTNGSASINSGQIIYNNSTGELLYDSDGRGGLNPAKFAILDGKEAITSKNFRLFGGNIATVSPTTPPVITLAVSPASVTEDGSTNLLYAFARTGATSHALTVNYSVNGTATLGTDYTGIPASPATKTITFAAGSATATVTVDPTTDSAVEPDETVSLTLAAGTGYTIGTADAIMGIVTTDDVVPTASALPKPKVIGAVDLDSASSSPATQSAGNAFDNKPSTKYLNFGGINSGINFNYSLPTRLSSFAITTANDAPARDPASYQLYGFQSGSWRLLTTGKLNLPNTRLRESAPISLNNLPSLTQYRLIFPTLKPNGNVMQIAGLRLYGTQSSPLPKPTTITAIDLDSSSSTPPTQPAGNAFDNKASATYLNFGGINSGIHFTYSLPTQPSSFVITTANNLPGRDPAAYQLYGFSQGSWKLLMSGSLHLPSARLTDSAPIALPNLPSLTQYRLTFPKLKANGKVMQIAELKLFGSQSSPPTPLPAPLPVITLAVSPASVPEDGSTNVTYTFTRTGSSSSALTVNYSVGGTATLDIDYSGIPATPATKTISFAAGSSTATVTVNPTSDSTVEPDETVALSLVAGTGYTIGTTTAVVGTITNDDVVAPPTPGAWTYNWANASPLGNIPSILKASVAMPSPRAGEPPLALTALRVDLRDPAIQLTSTGRRSDWANNTIETTTETSRQYINRSRTSGLPIVAAINTAPFDLNPAKQLQSVATNLRGFAVSDGVLVSSTDYNTDTFRSTFLYDPVTGARIENKASSLAAPAGVTYPAPAAEVALASTLKVATSGFGIVLNNGVISGDQVLQNSRSALGLTADGRYLTLLTVDRMATLGPTISVRGATQYDLGTILRGFGCSMGIEMDGGSSAQLAWWNPTSNQAQLLSNPLLERYVGSSLGVVYQPL